MSTNFPSGIDRFDLKINNHSMVRAEDVNNLQDAVTAIQTFLGVNPQGSMPSLAHRIAGVIGANGRLIPGSMDSASIPFNSLVNAHLRHGLADRFSFNGVDVGTLTPGDPNRLDNYGFDRGFTSIDAIGFRTHQNLICNGDGRFGTLTLPLFDSGFTPPTPSAGRVTLFARAGASTAAFPTLHLVSEGHNAWQIGTGGGGGGSGPGGGGSAIISGTVGDLSIVRGDVVFQNSNDSRQRWFKAEAIRGHLTNLAVCLDPGSDTDENTAQFVRFGQIMNTTNELPANAEVFLSQTDPGKVTPFRPTNGVVAYIGTTIGSRILNVAIGVSAYSATGDVDASGAGEWNVNRFFELNDITSKNSRVIWAGKNTNPTRTSPGTSVQPGEIFNQQVAISNPGFDGNYYGATFHTMGLTESYRNNFDFTRSIDGLYYLGMESKLVLYARVDNPENFDDIRIRLSSRSTDLASVDSGLGYSIKDKFIDNQWNKIEIPLKQYDLLGVVPQPYLGNANQTDFGWDITCIQTVSVETKSTSGGQLFFEYIGLEDTASRTAQKLQTVGNTKLVSNFYGNFDSVTSDSRIIYRKDDIYYSNYSASFPFSIDTPINGFYFNQPIPKDLSNITKFNLPIMITDDRSIPTLTFAFVSDRRYIPGQSLPNIQDLNRAEIEWDVQTAQFRNVWQNLEFGFENMTIFGDFDFSQVNAIYISINSNSLSPMEAFLTGLWGVNSTGSYTRVTQDVNNMYIGRVNAQGWIPQNNVDGKQIRINNIIQKSTELADGTLYDIINTDSSTIFVRPYPVINPLVIGDGRYGTERTFPVILNNACFEIVDSNPNLITHNGVFVSPEVTYTKAKKYGLVLTEGNTLEFRNIPNSVYYRLELDELKQSKFEITFGNGYLLRKRYMDEESTPMRVGFYEVLFQNRRMGSFRSLSGNSKIALEFELTDRNITINQNQTPVFVVPRRGPNSLLRIQNKTGVLVVQELTYSIIPLDKSMGLFQVQAFS